MDCFKSLLTSVSTRILHRLSNGKHVDIHDISHHIDGAHTVTSGKAKVYISHWLQMSLLANVNVISL